MKLEFELGPIYRAYFLDGTHIDFIVIGGEPLKVNVINPKDYVGSNLLSDVTSNYTKIEKISG